MKGMKGRLLKKMQSMKTVEYLTLHDRVLQVSNPNRYLFNHSCENTFNIEIQNKLGSHEIITEHKKNNSHHPVTKDQPEPENININTKDLNNNKEEEEEEEDDDEESVYKNKENNAPPIHSRKLPLPSESKAARFRKPDLNSYSLFDPNLLAAFHDALAEHLKAQKELEEADSLWEFPEKCPPGGSEAVILYTTSLRGIRKTFEGCVGVRFLLESLRVKYTERDVSMHAEFRDEMRRVLGDDVAVPPRLFVRGRYLGGAEDVVGLHERGRLRPLFLGLIVDEARGLCDGCGGARFVVCFGCSGSRKMRRCDDGDWSVCKDCNENGLILCPLCSSC